MTCTAACWHVSLISCQWWVTLSVKFAHGNRGYVPSAQPLPCMNPTGVAYATNADAHKKLNGNPPALTSAAGFTDFGKPCGSNHVDSGGHVDLVSSTYSFSQKPLSVTVDAAPSSVGSSKSTLVVSASSDAWMLDTSNDSPTQIGVSSDLPQQDSLNVGFTDPQELPAIDAEIEVVRKNRMMLKRCIMCLPLHNIFFFSNDDFEFGFVLSWAASFSSLLSVDDVDYSSSQTPVKNQGQCGSCWAHAFTEVMEWHYTNITGAIVELSRMEVLACTQYSDKCVGASLASVVTDFAISQQSLIPAYGRSSAPTRTSCHTYRSSATARATRRTAPSTHQTTPTSPARLRPNSALSTCRTRSCRAVRSSGRRRPPVRRAELRRERRDRRVAGRPGVRDNGAGLGLRSGMMSVFGFWGRVFSGSENEVLEKLLLSACTIQIGWYLNFAKVS